MIYEVTLPPDWKRVEQLRQAIVVCTDVIEADPILREVIPMVSAELLENAIKHGPNGQREVRYRLSMDDRGFAVSVVNHCHPQAASGAERLLDHIEWIGGFPTAEQAYLKRMQELFVGGNGDGGLGLVRVAYEGNCRLYCDLDLTSHELEVRAEYAA